MNKIWAFLILFSVGAALFVDSRDIYRDAWENKRTWSARTLSDVDWSKAGSVSLLFEHETDTILARYAPPPGATITFLSKNGLPELLEKRYGLLKEGSGGLKTRRLRIDNDRVLLDFEPVKWTKMSAITDAAFDMAKTAVTLAIGLIGAMALWLGLMRIAEQSGLIEVVVKVVRPLIGRLFPDLPENSPALGAISLNLAANVLGLGNAATPLGIKAMEELKKLQPESDEASHAMCMFLAINTSSVQLLPPVTLVALLGAGVAPLLISITLATIVSTTVGVSLALYYRRKAIKA